MLVWITFLPLLGALLLALVPIRNTAALRLLALGVTGVVAILGAGSTGLGGRGGSSITAALYCPPTMIDATSSQRASG